MYILLCQNVNKHNFMTYMTSTSDECAVKLLWKFEIDFLRIEKEVFYAYWTTLLEMDLQRQMARHIL